MIYLAYVNNEIAGQIRVMKSWNKYALIDDFAVDTKYRRQGVGPALIEQCIQWAGAGGFPGVALETQNINVPACKLYESTDYLTQWFWDAEKR